MRLDEQFQYVLDHYLSDYDDFDRKYTSQTKPKFKDYITTKIIKEEIRTILENYILTSKYKIKGSTGISRMSGCPWIAVMNKKVTTSPMRGYGIVYLFDTEMDRVYLSLNQGWNQYRHRVKKDLESVKEAREEIFNNSEIARQKLKSIQGFSLDNIDLNSKPNTYANFYELGNIASKCYSNKNIPPEKELIDDLHNALGLYRELESEIGLNIMNISGVYTEPDKKNKISKAEKEHHIRKNASITGNKAEEIFEMRALEKFGYDIENVTDETGHGYDFISTDGKFCFEVKGFKEDFADFRMTSREWTTARDKKENYFLILVSYVYDESKCEIKRYQNPYKLLSGKESPYSPPSIVEYRFKGKDLYK